MKKILLPVITLFLIGLGLVSCKDSSNTKKLLFIDVTHSPTDYVFSEGDIVKEHLIVKGLYSDGSEKTLSKESYSTNLTDDKVTSTTKSVTVTYQSKTKTIPITVRTDSKTLTSIDVTSDKYVFDVGEEIKPHLTVKGIYSDGSEQTVTDYTVSPTVVTSTTDKVTINYQSKTKTIPISVSRSSETLERIEVLSLPTKINYRENSLFDVRGLVIVGVYSDSSRRVITDYTLSIPNGTTVGQVSGTDLSTTKTNTVTYNGDSSIKTSFDITVRKLSSYTMKEKGNWLPSSVTKENITKIVFDYTDDLPSNIKDKLHIHIGNSKDDIIYLIEDGTVLYIFSDGIICGNNDCSNMFEGFSSLEEITFNNFDTSNVTNMEKMFTYCEKLKSLDLSNFNTSKVTNMGIMFYDCKNLNLLNLSSLFDTSKVESMFRMFDYCSSLTTLDLSMWNTSNVTDMYEMFDWCENLTSLDISKFDITTITTERPSVDTEDMFNKCGISGTSKIKINPTQKEKFDTVLSGWNYDGVNTYTKN